MFACRRDARENSVCTPTTGGRRAKHFGDVRRLLLVVEVISPATARTDRQLKRELYLRHGVDEYWIVDLDARLIERWRPGDERPEILTDRISWPQEGVEPLTIELESVFRGVSADDQR